VSLNFIKRSGHESMKGGREKERERVIVYKSYFEYKIQCHLGWHRVVISKNKGLQKKEPTM
jgi:hypothetical protein